MSEAANRQHSGSRCAFRNQWSEENFPERVKICTSVCKARDAMQDLNAKNVNLVYVQQGQR